MSLLKNLAIAFVFGNVIIFLVDKFYIRKFLVAHSNLSLANAFLGSFFAVFRIFITFVALYIIHLATLGKVDYEFIEKSKVTSTIASASDYIYKSLADAGIISIEVVEYTDTQKDTPEIIEQMQNKFIEKLTDQVGGDVLQNFNTPTKENTDMLHKQLKQIDGLDNIDFNKLINGGK